MPTALADDPVFIGLRAEYQQKEAEANRIIGEPSPTGERLRLAERLATKDLPDLQRRMDERKDDLDRLERTRGAMGQAQSWRDQPQRKMPFSASMGGSSVGDVDRYGGRKNAADIDSWRVTGWEEAGQTSLQYNPKAANWEAFNESGAGTFGAKQWEVLNEFEYKRAWRQYLRYGQKAIDKMEFKILQEGLDDQGGVFAPAEFLARIIGREPAPTLLRSLVTTLTTGRDKLIMPRLQYSADDIYTTAFRVTWTGEIPANSDVAEVNDSNLTGNIDIDVHTAMMTGAVTRNQIEDSAFPIQAWLESKYAQTIDITYEDMILNGSTLSATTAGAPYSQPIGILFGAKIGNVENNTSPEVLQSAASGAVDYGSFMNMQGALAPQYETETTRWVMAKRSTWTAITKLTDSNNRPLFTTGMQDFGMVMKRGRVLLGDDMVLSQLMPPLAAGNFPVIYGDLRGYFLAQRVGFSIQVLDQTRAKQNQIELVGRVRFGGRPVEPWRLKILST